MISKEIFHQGMGTLGASYGRELGAATTRVYFTALSSHLTDEQFIDAVNKVIVSERFWPSPAVILEAAGADAETVAQTAFREVTDALNAHGGYRFLPSEISTAWDAATWAGLKAIGGLREITECTEQRWPGLVKKFVKAYQDALSPRPALPSSSPDPRVKKLVADTGRAMALPKGDR